MFIRIKRIKGYEYAYLVENTWKRTGSRQKVKDYLGRVYPLSYHEQPLTMNFSDKSFVDIVSAALHAHLSANGFHEENHQWKKDSFVVDFNKSTVMNGSKQAVFKSGDGYLCSHTLKHLLAFKAQGYEEEVGLRLAKAFVEAGIPIPKAAFIAAFEKIYKIS